MIARLEVARNPVLDMRLLVGDIDDAVVGNREPYDSLVGAECEFPYILLVLPRFVW